jgi:hypothetical protein
MTPAIIGVEQAIRHAIVSYLNGIEHQITQFLEWDDKPLGGRSPISLQDISKRCPDDVLLLYAVSGSGKTRSIEHLLCRNWGYYFLPGNLGQTEQSNLYDAQPQGYSKDSYFLWKCIQNFDKIVPRTDITGIGSWNVSNRIILSRHLIFDRFLKAAARVPGKKTPANWLRFQKSCSNSDPFEGLFRLLLLINSGTDKLGFEMSNLEALFSGPDLTHYPRTLYLCLDEAQCYFDTGIFSTSFGGEYKNYLELALEDLLLRTSFSFPFMDQRVVVSGTSLKVHHIISTITKTQKLPDAGGKSRYAKCKKVTEFPLRTDPEALEDLLQQWGALERLRPHLSSIKHHGTPLSGRYLWSSRYIDRLVKESERRSIDLTDIRFAANESICEAKDSLKERLSRLSEDGHLTILEELCSVVIQSDLLDQPTIFQNDKDHQMISEAFAVVEKHENNLVGTLKELLAMEAAIEWFRKEKWDLYEKKVKAYLSFATNDPGSFGKGAEWFLALVRILLRRIDTS